MCYNTKCKTIMYEKEVIYNTVITRYISYEPMIHCTQAWLARGFKVPPKILGPPRYLGPPIYCRGAGPPKYRSPQKNC